MADGLLDLWDRTPSSAPAELHKQTKTPNWVTVTQQGSSPAETTTTATPRQLSYLGRYPTELHTGS